MKASFVVVGIAQPQGSKSARVVKGRAILTEGFGDGPRQKKEWRSAVAACARLWSEQHNFPAPMDGPLELSVDFYLPRPKSAGKKVLYPDKKPDCSKLIRAVEDSLTGVLIVDDARIVRLNVRKLFAVDSPARAEITVCQIEAA